AIMAGLMLSGTGKAWIGAVRFEPVDSSVPVTNLIADRAPRSLPSGRIGEALFNAERVDAGVLRFTPQPDGAWKSNLSDVLTLEGNTVKGTLKQLPVNVTVRTGGPSTFIQGVWGNDQLSIELGPEKLVMKKGINTRELVREDERRDNGRCIRYRN